MLNRFLPSLICRDIHLGLKNLRLHAMRSFLTMLGMIFGVASVIAMLAVGQGASKEALEQIRQLGSDVVVMESVNTVSKDNQRQGQNLFSVYGVTYLDVVRLRDTIPNVRRIVPVKIRHERVVSQAQEIAVRLVGTTSHWFDLVSRPLVAGRLLTPLDEQRRHAVAVITEKMAQQLFPLQAVLGNFVRVGGNVYRVVGVIRSAETEGDNVTSPDRDADIYIPLTVMREHTGDLLVSRLSGSTVREKVELHQVFVQMESESVVEAVASAIDHLIGQFHRKEDVAIKIPLVLLRQAEKTQRRFNIVLGAIAGISLLVGGIGIMNIMLASVTERTREIGIRRAIGARRHQIVSQFLIETVVLSCSGGFLGCIVGLILPWSISKITGLSTVVTSGSLVLSLLISLSVGIIFGLYPAIRASKLDPITALRHE
ncbi:MAG: macrolide export ATP-binding/permease MacB [Desulfuromonadales bacterium C00003068]|jgi:putative ABC transport system permease protein|nr:MAG: macrolide export ATP-binding/permease MacB [Desulfuromonadales bacterium C00003068]